MKIALCMITKGDEELDSLKKAIDSVIEYVDTVHITANSNKVGKTRTYVEKKGWDYSYLKWDDDFAAQRNFNNSKVPEGTDYIFWMDSDDILIGGEHLREIAKQAKASQKTTVFMTYWYSCKFSNPKKRLPENIVQIEIQQQRERLMVPSKVLWKKRLHETPVEVEGAKYALTNLEHTLEEPNEVFPIAIMHTSMERNLDKDIMKERMDRNRRLLELQLDDELKTPEGADPRTLLYLLKVYAEGTEEKYWQKCIEMGQEYMTKSGWKEERGVCAEQMARCFFNMGDLTNAINMMHLAIKNHPGNPIYYFRLARFYFNAEDHKSMEHWMKMGLSMDIDKSAATIYSPHELKAMAAEVTMKYHYNVSKDIEKAYESAMTMYDLEPTEINKQGVDLLYDMNELNEACRHAHNLIGYLHSIDDQKAGFGVLESLPDTIKDQPFARKLYSQLAPPRKWADNEICYFANFGNKHFEEWDGDSLQRGIGGSETAVIELAKEWTKMGYKITVYGDPGPRKGDYEGVTYLPWYHFNRRDNFNIFIQWRNAALAGIVKTKKYFVDLHDVWSELDYMDKLDSIDGLMVKSEYHRNLAPNIPDEKFITISNGIRV